MKQFRTSILVIICLLAIISSTFSQDKNKMNEEIKKFDAFYLKGTKDYGLIGSSLMMVHDNKVISQNFHGMSHFANNYKTDENTIIIGLRLVKLSRALRLCNFVTVAN